MTDQVVVKTDREFFDEMIALINGTHWTKRTLACVNIVHDRYKNGKFKYRKIKVIEGGDWNNAKSAYDDRTYNVKVPLIGDDGKVVVKPTACLVGLVLKVEGLDWEPIDPDLNPTYIDDLIREEEAYLENEAEVELGTGSVFSESRLGTQGNRIVKKIAYQLGEKYPGSFTRHGLTLKDDWSRISNEASRIVVERWNDMETTDKAMVIEVVTLARDAEPLFLPNIDHDFPGAGS